jgi:hypothetical protein
MGAHTYIKFCLVAGFLVAPLASDAVWICHTEDGRSWQQEYPPCKMPAEVSTLSPARQRGRPPEPSDRVRQAQASSYAPATGSENIRALYDRAVSELEARYPVLNPDLPGYDSALAAQVLAQKAVYVRQAYREDYAIRAAVAAVMAPRPPPLSQAVQTSPNAHKQSQGTDAVVEATANGALRGLVYALLVPIAWGIRWLWRKTAKGATRAAYLAGNTSATDIARAAGSASARVQKRSAGFVEAFRQGRRDAEKRGE